MNMIGRLKQLLRRVFASTTHDSESSDALENPMLAIRSGFVSITGNFRDNNEDNCVIDPQQRFVVVADGMGGQSAGEKASALAVELIPQKLLQLLELPCPENKEIPSGEVIKALDKSIDFANGEIMALSEMNPGFRNMGTTVVMLVRVGKRLFVSGVGDSRAYELRKGTLRQLTTDHSLTQALIEAGTISPQEAKTHRYRNVLYRYLGTRDGSSGSNAAELTPHPGDKIILCSDGVTDGVPDAELTRILQAHDDPSKAAEAIVLAAQAGGSRDNITCAAVFVD
jgi:protein phosphatase